MTDYKITVHNDGRPPLSWSATVFENDAPDLSIAYAEWREVHWTDGSRSADVAQKRATDWIDRQQENYELTYTPEKKND